MAKLYRAGLPDIELIWKRFRLIQQPGIRSVYGKKQNM